MPLMEKVVPLMEKVANLIEKVDLLVQQPTITASQAPPPSSSQSIQCEASPEKTPSPSSCIEINVEPSSPSQHDSRTVQCRQRQRGRRIFARVTRQSPIPYTRFHHQQPHRRVAI